MRQTILAFLLAVAVVPCATAQVTPSRPSAADPANKPPPLPAPSTSIHPNPAAAPVQPASDAGATERGLAPVEPGKPGVTHRVQDANTNGHDAQGHVLDPNGKPVGQKPAQPAQPSPATSR
jgi:hypothetical protein